MEEKPLSAILINLIKENTANMLTIVNLFMGFLAIVYLQREMFSISAAFILIAMFFDGLDGKVARAMSIESTLGKELDSLSDVISFGVGPAVLAYTKVLHMYGLLGMIVSGLFLVAGALRLARFNAMPSNNDFTGVPITIAGGLLAMGTMTTLILSPPLLLITTILLSFLMVSNLKYYKVLLTGVKISKYSKVFIPVTFSIFIIVSIVNIETTFMLVFFLLTIYVVVSPLRFLFAGIKKVWQSN